MVVAVSGATGHIGGHLVRALLARGDRVRALVRGDAAVLRGLEIEVVRGDARDPGAVSSLLATADLAFDLAARISIDPRDDAEVSSNNVQACRTVADACLARGIRLVHFSSIHALRSSDGPIDETAPLAVDHPFAYDRSKARGESEVIDRVARGLDAVILNPTAVIGPLDFRPSEMGRFLLRLARRRLPCLVDGGFNWVDARDVAAGAVAAADRGRSGERYLLPGTWKSVRDIAGIARDVAGVRPPRLTLSVGTALMGVPFAAALSRITGARPIFTRLSLDALRHHRHVRGDKAAEELGYRTRPIEETLADTFAWFAGEGMT